MEKQGLLTRKRGKEDTRQRIVSLTKQGKALEEQAKNIPDCLESELAGKMEDINSLRAAMPAMDALIDGLAQRTKQ